MVDNFDCNIIYGHTHDIQEMPKIALGDNKTKMGKSIGCECLYAQKYLKGNPTKWQQAFSVVIIHDNGMYNEYNYKIINHKFITFNKVYK